MNDTITAISTSLGVGAISIIRVSGKDAIEIVNSITYKKRIDKVKTNTINYDKIIYNNEVIDEVLISVMKSPNTYTGEDIVEINCHGGIAVTNKILQILLESGCRLANPGEFTERRFINGKIDILQAEGIMDLINSKNEITRKMAINQVDGKVSKMIKDIRDNDFAQILSNINVNIDYPEYEDIEVITINDIKVKLNELEEKIHKIIEESKNAKIIKEGITTAIIGRPNVGKSSLLNKLIKEDKAIVTDIEGTTRDIVEGSINIDGLTLNIIDTAGIRETEDIIESIGVKKSLDLIDKSDLILFVLNNNEEITPDIEELLEKLDNRKYILIINKNDLESKLDKSKLEKFANIIINISVLNNEGIEELKNKIVELFNINELETKDPTYLSNSRSISILKRCLTSIEDIEQGLKENRPIDMIELDIKNIWEELGHINGTTYEEELLDEMFSRFCLGK